MAKYDAANKQWESLIPPPAINAQSSSIGQHFLDTILKHGDKVLQVFSSKCWVFE